MYPHALIDLHCDTLTACMDEEFRTLYENPETQKMAADVQARHVRERDTLDVPGSHFALSQLPQGVRWCQCCAIFVLDGLSRAESIAYYDLFQHSFHRQCEKLASLAAPCRTAADLERAWAQGKTALILTVENGAALAGDLDRVETLYRDGVRILTLAWNGENEIASGKETDHGLSQFGRQVVPALEERGILVDVSHLNDRSFWDVAGVATRPFVASHSNARQVCGHSRNLTDEQIRELVARKCLVGLNYSIPFLHEGGGRAEPDDLCRHIDRFLELGAEHCLALGSDADGTIVPPWLDSGEKMAGLYGLLLDRGYAAQTLDGIFWKNALEFFQNNLR